MTPAVFIILFVAVLIGIVTLGWRQAAKRRKALQAWASLQGLDFDRHPEAELEDRYPLHDCLKAGSSRYGTNVMRGTRHGREVRLFDYHYVTYSSSAKGGRKANHHWFSAVVIDSGLPLRSLAIRPEHFFDRVAEFVGWDDIDFELGSFSRAFHVKSPDKRWAYDVLHQRTMELLLESPQFTIELAGLWLMVRRDKLFQPADFSDALAVGEGILNQLPEYLLRELKGAGA